MLFLTMFYSFEIIFFVEKQKKSKGEKNKMKSTKSKKTQSKKFIKTKNSQKNS